MLDNLAKQISEIACAAIERGTEAVVVYKGWLALLPFPIYLVASFITATVATVVIIAAASCVLSGIVLITLLAIIERLALAFYQNTIRDWAFRRSGK